MFLLDCREVVRRGVQDPLDAEVVGIGIGTVTVDHELSHCPALRPDVTILDARLPGGDGIAVCDELLSRRGTPTPVGRSRAKMLT
ncbi:hypothetical protein ACFV1C_03125 [Streptomyces sp. NPDC059605]|uniref:hypothetical protein n=1 Tax=unclassified Streptomyces TaxID=2593676 RepID=UPI0036BD5702